VPTYIYFKLSTFQYLASDYTLPFASQKKKNSQFVYFAFFLFGYILTRLSFLFVGKCEFLSNDFNKYTFENLDDWESLGFFPALVEFKGQLFSYLDNLIGLNCIEKGM
jgi:hypothetical protein